MKPLIIFFFFSNAGGIKRVRTFETAEERCNLAKINGYDEINLKNQTTVIHHQHM